MKRHSQKQEKSPDQGPDKSAPPRTSLLMAVATAVTAVLLFFLLLEGGLALFRVQPLAEREDTFVGFASNVPLFVPSSAGMTTATNRLAFFNRQTFQREKPAGTYRIFTLGGSTTYGRPYKDSTSFSGYLRELLPRVDGARPWEVINAGGISYASYRAAHLMEELIEYQPDLFIVYTGHNEFLEERTYGKIREIPSAVRSLVSTLTKTRTWTVMQTGLQKVGLVPQADGGQRTRLPGEVDTILDRSVGLDRYTRDDQLREDVLRHFRLSLKRMVSLARSAGAEIIFVTPATNLKDCSPFKSEHTDALSQADRALINKLSTQASRLMKDQAWPEALILLSVATKVDPRNAEVQYLRGQTLLSLGRYEEAETALRQAQDEDVCPLRALTPMPEIVAEITREEGVGLVDYDRLVAGRMLQEKGFPIPGEEYFLDHVHPTIAGHKLLAVALLEKMIDDGLVRPDAKWGDAIVAQVDEQIRSRIDREAHSLALANLARVMHWAKKFDDAERLALQALEMGEDFKATVINATSILSSVYVRKGTPDKAIRMLYVVLEKFPDELELRMQLGQFLLGRGVREFEKATANLLLVSRAKPNFDVIYSMLGRAQTLRGRHRIAWPNLKKALELNPDNIPARQMLERLQPLDEQHSFDDRLPRIELSAYPSGTPRQLVQLLQNQQGLEVPDGVRVEFFENGRVSRFEDLTMGRLDAVFTWDPEGNPLKQRERN